MDPAAGVCEEDKDLDFYDFEPLPTLPEDEVSPQGPGGVLTGRSGEAPGWVRGYRPPSSGPAWW